MRRENIFWKSTNQLKLTDEKGEYFCYGNPTPSLESLGSLDPHRKDDVLSKNLFQLNIII